jgi:hypothetical protein
MTTRFDMFMYPPAGTGNYYDNLKSLGAFNLRMSNASPIGHLSATFKVPAVGNEPRGGVPQIFTPYNDLRIYDGAECCWRGRLARAQFTVTNEGRWWELTADGYGAHLGDPIVQTFNFRNLQSSAAVSTLISTYATAIDSTDITATSRTFDNSADITLRGRSLAGLIAFAALLGNSSDKDQLWDVYADRLSAARVFRFGPRPSSAAYYVSSGAFDEAQWGYDIQTAFNRVEGDYNAGASFATTANDTAAQTRWAVVKALVVQAHSLVSSTDANNMVNVLLSKLATLRMDATHLRAIGNANSILITDSDRQRVAPWFVRAGYLMQLQDVLPGLQPAGAADFNNLFLVGRSEYDEDAQTWTVTPEGFHLTMQRMFAATQAYLGRMTGEGF